MKTPKLTKLRFSIWFYFLLFTLVLVLVMWVVQLFLFDSFYQGEKEQSTRRAGVEMTEQFNVEGEVTQVMFNAWMKKTIDLAEDGYSLYLAKFENGKVSFETIYGASGIIDDEESNFSTAEQEIVSYGITSYLSGTSDYVLEKYTYDSADSYYVFTSKIKNQRFGEVYLIISTGQRSLNESIGAIQLQFIIVTAILLVLSFFLSMYISNKLSKPIIDMSQTAKKWAQGDETVTFYASDYMELSELADALNYAKDGISKTGRLQADLIANVSHDLKTPLTMIKAYAEMIRDISGGNREKRNMHTQIIIDETDRLTMLVNDILDLSKLQNGINQLNLTRFDLSALCNKVLLQMNDFVERDGFTIISEIEPDLYVEADEKRIEQVIYNLVGNSINYTGEDKTIKFHLAKKDDIILLEIFDSGKGISKENVTTIWEKYYRASETHKRPVKGTGLGLSIVKTILENHNLRFGVVTKEGVGSNFFVEFTESKNE